MNKDKAKQAMMDLIAINTKEDDVISILEAMRDLLIDIQEVEGDKFSSELEKSISTAIIVAKNYKNNKAWEKL